jgi:hypothetical protein
MRDDDGPPQRVKVLGGTPGTTGEVLAVADALGGLGAWRPCADRPGNGRRTGERPAPRARTPTMSGTVAPAT